MPFADPALAGPPVSLPRAGGLSLTLSPDHFASPALPIVFCAALGQTCLRGELAADRWPPVAAATVEAVAAALATARGGLHLALLDLPGAPRWVALVQGDRSPYVARHAPAAREPAWRGFAGPLGTASPDAPAPAWPGFYISAGAALLDAIDRAWAAPEIVVSHAPQGGWPGHSLPWFLTGVATAAAHRELHAERIRFYFGDCGLPHADLLPWAHAYANAAELGPMPRVRRVAPLRLGLPKLAGVEILKVRVR